MLFKKMNWLALLGSALLVTAAPVFAQDSGPLIDILVKKGIVTDQEAEDLRADLVKDFTNNTSAGKMNLSSSLVEFKISGDVRMRYEYNNQAPEIAGGGFLVDNETSRQRFRFRFNVDVALQKGWTTGFSLETGQSSDSANQTFTGAGDDYGVFVTRAFIGYQPNLNWAFVAGKQKNIMYTSDMRWDPDIYPQGVSEIYKYFSGPKDTFEVRAMQHAMQDNNEQVFGPLGRDAWMFEQQAVFTHWFQPDNLSNLIVAVGYSAYNQSNIPSSATVTPSNSPLNSGGYVGSVRAQDYGSLAGEVNFANINGDGTSFKVYWDSSYNFTGGTRAYNVYGLNPALFSKGAAAYLGGIGYSYGTGKVQGDYSAKLDYRYVGVTAVDPNTNDSDWALSKTNQQGLKLGLSYQLTDFSNVALAYFHTTKIQSGMTFALGNLDHSDELLADLVIKF